MSRGRITRRRLSSHFRIRVEASFQSTRYEWGPWEPLSETYPDLHFRARIGFVTRTVAVFPSFTAAQIFREEMRDYYLQFNDEYETRHYRHYRHYHL